MRFTTVKTKESMLSIAKHCPVYKYLCMIDKPSQVRIVKHILSRSRYFL